MIDELSHRAGIFFVLRKKTGSNICGSRLSLSSLNPCRLFPQLFWPTRVWRGAQRVNTHVNPLMSTPGIICLLRIFL